MDKMKDRFRGCLIGGAIGDALGYPVEFLSYNQIQEKYGPDGIRQFDLTDGKALISDDTQMTLFTANGLLCGETRQCLRGISGFAPNYVWRAYLDWLVTQDKSDKEKESISWLSNIPELQHQRAPGATCLAALRAGVPGTIENPINNSKGCGGIMRVAPAALICTRTSINLPNCAQENIPAMLGAEIAALTHGHPLGYIPAAAFTSLLYRICMQQDQNSEFQVLVQDCMKEMITLFGNSKDDCECLARLTQQALSLAEQGIPDESAIKQLGEGWVAEETFAIAVYCCCKYRADFKKAVAAAVNHDGDSDSTGAVTGNIMGAMMGHDLMLGKYYSTFESLELSKLILEMADDLYDGCQMSEYSEERDEKWLAKYVYATWPQSYRVAGG